MKISESKTDGRWVGVSDHILRQHFSKSRRIIPGQRIHASIIFANKYRPMANLGDGIVFPIELHALSYDKLDDVNWEQVSFDPTAVKELFGYFQLQKGAALTSLDRLLFALRFSEPQQLSSLLDGSNIWISEEGKKCVREEGNWQETFKNFIQAPGRSSVEKLIAVVAYYEACESSRTILHNKKR